MTSTNRLIVGKVDKFNSNWNANTLFTNFRVRAILKHHDDFITKINSRHQLTRRLRREVGEEGTDWMIVENDQTGENELYLPNSGKLVMWKLQDNTNFNELFERVEQHHDGYIADDEVREDE